MENNSQLHTNLPSDSSYSSYSSKVFFCDEEVILASSNPKKRGGRMKFKETRHPVYRGVRKRNSGKWVCEVREPNKTNRIWLGTYATADMAARAHDVAAIALRGRSACLNFADSTWRLPIPASSDVKDIQRAAAEAGEMFAEEELDVSTGDCCVIEESPDTYSSLPENMFYDEVMPELLANMAEGLMLPPPYRAGKFAYGGDDMELSTDMSLWSFST